MNNIKKLGYIFDKKQKRILVVLGVLIFIGGVLETLGVSVLLPVVAAIVDVDSTMDKWYVRPFLDAFHINDSTQFIVLLLSALIAIYTPRKRNFFFPSKMSVVLRQGMPGPLHEHHAGLSQPLNFISSSPPLFF